MKDLTTRENAFSTPQKFDESQRMALLLAKSDLVPTIYKGNVSNTLIALDMATRMCEMPLTIMQNLDIIHGKPSFSSKFIISRINDSGLFQKRLSFKYGVDGTVTIPTQSSDGKALNRGGQTVENMTCYAYTVDHEGNEVKGTTASIKMAISEGWYTRKDSKWHTMYEQQIAYRAAAFFSRVHCPDVVLGGIRTTEELIDTIDTTATIVEPKLSKLQELNEKKAVVLEVKQPEHEPDTMEEL